MTVELFYTPTSCGAATFIAAHKAGLIQSGKVVPNEVAISTHTVVAGPKAGTDFYTINPKGNVPSLILDDSNKTLLNENAATLQYIADLAGPDSKLAPAAGTTERFPSCRMWVQRSILQSEACLASL